MKSPSLSQLTSFLALLAAAVPLAANATTVYQVKVPVTALKPQSDSAAVLSLSTASLPFGSQVVGTTSTAKSVIVTNTGTAPTTVAAPTVTGPFQANTSCATLAAGNSCIVNVTFTPTGVGAASGLLSFGTGVGAQSVALAGSGTGASWTIQGTPSTSFGPTHVGTYASPDQTISLKNTGDAAGSLALPAFDGSAAMDYSASSTCSNIAVGNTCTVTVRFNPTQVANPRTAALGIGGTTLAYTGSALAAPTDPNFANVSLLMHFDGASGSTAFTDVKGNTFTASVATISSASKFGTGAFYGPSDVNSRVTGTSNGALAFGTGDFTVEFWVNYSNPPQGYHQYALSSGVTGNSFNVNRFNTNGLITAGAVVASNIAPSLSAWHHIAAARVSGTIRLFIDGALTGTATDTTNYSDMGVFVGGLDANHTGREVSGYLDELRVTKGVGRYVAPFTPPTAPYPDQ